VYLPLTEEQRRNTGILHFVQDDDLKRNEIDGFKRDGIGYIYLTIRSRKATAKEEKRERVLF
jgi:hypothetical protein